jgi:hypothetical protein
LRIALVSAVKRTSTGELRSVQELAGRTVLEWQIDLALELGCERIICLCESSFDELIAQQRRVEREGFAFHAARTHLQLADLVRPNDAVFVQLDGLLAGGEGAEQVREAGKTQGNVIFAIAESHALTANSPDDFERIDRDRHWAGIAFLPGDCVNNLKEMPGDSDAISALLRLGLQARVGCKEIAPEFIDHDQWFLASDTDALGRRSVALMNASLPKPAWSGPGVAFATSIVRFSPSSWLGIAPETSAGMALAAMAVGLGLAGFGLSAVALVVGSLATFGASLCITASSMKSGLASSSKRPRILHFFVASIWILATILLVIANREAANWSIQAAIPVLVMGLAWLAGGGENSRLQAFWRDLPVHFAIFSGAAYFNHLQEALLLFSLLALAQLMLHALPQKAKVES